MQAAYSRLGAISGDHGDLLKTSLFRRAVWVGIVLASVFLPHPISPWFAFFLFSILYGLWYGLYLFVLPRARQAGGMAILFLSLFVMMAGENTYWVAALGGVLFLHGNWHAFVAAARLDE